MAKAKEKISDQIEKAKILLEKNGHNVTEKYVGRPTTYDPKYCEMLIDHMSQGLSFEAFAGKIEVTFKTLYNWAEANPEFLQAKETGQAKSRLFWEQLGNSGAAGHLPGFNSAAYKYNMANRFKWTDRQDLTSGGKKLPEGNGPVIIALPTNGREQKK